MLPLFKKYFKRRPPKNTKEEIENNNNNNNNNRNTADMPPDNKPNGSSYICFRGCLTAGTNSAPVERSSQTATVAVTPTTTTTRTTRSNFSKTTTSSLFPSTQFTNHESLPSMSDAFSIFLSVFPQYGGTQMTDSIRQLQYSHLSTHACFDYSGIGLFSHSQMDPDSAATSTSTDVVTPSSLKPPFFEIAYKSASLRSQVQSRDKDTSLEAEIRKRIMKLLSISEEEYSMVCTANRITAFRLLAESYSFKPNNKLLTVYDYESEAVTAMIETAQKKGADVATANFTWPGLRINKKLTKKLAQKKKRKGLFVFPLISRMTGTRYPYLWMKLAQDHGWHIALDACALGPKDLDSLGLSLIQPDFIICNFFKVFGENPSGFAGLFVKKSSCEALERSSIARSIGIVNIVPARRFSIIGDNYSGTDLEASQPLSMRNGEEDIETASSFSGPIGPQNKENRSQELGDVSKILEEEKAPEIEMERERETRMEIECHALDHANTLGLLLISTRLRCVTNWLVVALSKLRHPNSTNGYYLVRIYGPRVKFDRGPALAFNIFDWKGEKIDPSLVQKLGDRSGISLGSGFLKNILFENVYGEDKIALEKKEGDENDVGISVVNVSFGFLSSFEDAYKLWVFIAKFLDADFVEKERWRYMALNQKMVEI